MSRNERSAPSPAKSSQTGSPVRSGPGEACAIETTVTTTYFYPYCWVKNDYGNVWWYGYTIGSAGGLRYGWLWSGNWLRANTFYTTTYRCF